MRFSARRGSTLPRMTSCCLPDGSLFRVKLTMHTNLSILMAKSPRFGQVCADRLAVGLLGTYENQENRMGQSDDDNDASKTFWVKCKDSKLQLSLRRPSQYPNWTTDYDTAVSRLDALQLENAIVKTSAPRKWFLDKTTAGTYIRFNFGLWDKKVCTTSRLTTFYRLLVMPSTTEV